MAYDRDAWVKDVLTGLGSPTLTWIPKGYPGYQEGETRLGFNPEEAKKALAASKYGSVDKLPPIDLDLLATRRATARATNGWPRSGRKSWVWTSSSTRSSPPPTRR